MKHKTTSKVEQINLYKRNGAEIFSQMIRQIALKAFQDQYFLVPFKQKKWKSVKIISKVCKSS